ncbi:Hypothetical protein, putative [Bodo saltans]|uniref:Uncharacterized protein n=1 Tax=Bodo saltans TaxID=75058 RepID=A0A0S4KN53_BODSA|nr:Hypothetical protein, putative [Bodo saltans]|eukprot:CUI14962.1 Hypothetical protein, putative [Bodo saltans]
MGTFCSHDDAGDANKLEVRRKPESDASKCPAVKDTQEDQRAKPCPTQVHSLRLEPSLNISLELQCSVAGESDADASPHNPLDASQHERQKRSPRSPRFPLVHTNATLSDRRQRVLAQKQPSLRLMAPTVASEFRSVPPELPPDVKLWLQRHHHVGHQSLETSMVSGPTTPVAIGTSVISPRVRSVVIVAE